MPTGQLQHKEEVAAHADPYTDLVHPQEPGVDLQQVSDQGRLKPAGTGRLGWGDGRGKQALNLKACPTYDGSFSRAALPALRCMQ